MTYWESEYKRTVTKQNHQKETNKEIKKERKKRGNA
jgi:hypothetical protein